MAVAVTGLNPALVLELAVTASGVSGFLRAVTASTIAAEASMPVTNAPRRKTERELSIAAAHRGSATAHIACECGN